MSGTGPQMRLYWQATTSHPLHRSFEAPKPNTMPTLPVADFPVSASIIWFYLIANSLRGFTYIPQIVVAWRSKDGAKSLSLLTWSLWLVANIAAVLYGLHLGDLFFTVVSLINCTGCGLVAGIAWSRRRQWRRANRVAVSSPTSFLRLRARRHNFEPLGSSAKAYLRRWGCGPRWLNADFSALHHVAPQLSHAWLSGRRLRNVGVRTFPACGFERRAMEAT